MSLISPLKADEQVPAWPSLSNGSFTSCPTGTDSANNSFSRNPSLPHFPRRVSFIEPTQIISCEADIENCDVRNMALMPVDTTHYLWASEHDGAIVVIDTATKQPVHQVSPVSRTLSLAADCFGRVWGGFSDGSILAWDNQFEETDVMQHPAGPVTCIVGDGPYVYSASGSAYSTIYKWDAETFSMVRKFTPLNNVFRGLAVHDRYVYSVSDDPVIRVWDAELGSCVEGWVGSSNPLRCICKYDTTIWVGGDDGQVSVWEAMTGKCIKMLSPPHSGPVQKLTVIGNTVWSGASDCLLRVWHAQSLALITEETQANCGEVNAVFCVGRWTFHEVWTAGPKAMKVWNVASLAPTHVPKKEDGGAAREPPEAPVSEPTDPDAAAARVGELERMLAEEREQSRQLRAQVAGMQETMDRTATQHRDDVRGLEKRVAEQEALAAAARATDEAVREAEARATELEGQAARLRGLLEAAEGGYDGLRTALQRIVAQVNGAGVGVTVAVDAEDPRRTLDGLGAALHRALGLRPASPPPGLEPPAPVRLGGGASPRDLNGMELALAEAETEINALKNRLWNSEVSLSGAEKTLEARQGAHQTERQADELRIRGLEAELEACQARAREWEGGGRPGRLEALQECQALLGCGEGQEVAALQALVARKAEAAPPTAGPGAGDAAVGYPELHRANVELDRLNKRLLQGMEQQTEELAAYQRAVGALEEKLKAADASGPQWYPPPSPQDRQFIAESRRGLLQNFNHLCEQARKGLDRLGKLQEDAGRLPDDVQGPGARLQLGLERLLMSLREQYYNFRWVLANFFTPAERKAVGSPVLDVPDATDAAPGGGSERPGLSPRRKPKTKSRTRSAGPSTGRAWKAGTGAPSAPKEGAKAAVPRPLKV